MNNLSIFKYHENTLKEFDREISEELLEYRLNKIANIYEQSDDYACYVYGMGAHPKSTYIKIKQDVDLELIWFDSILPGKYRFLRFFVASYAGLVKVKNPRKIPKLMKKLSHLSMAGIYIIKKSVEQDFLNSVLNNPTPNKFDFGIKSEGSYFCYIIDADNSESITGIYEIVSYGKDSLEFQNIFED